MLGGLLPILGALGLKVGTRAELSTDELNKGEIIVKWSTAEHTD